MTVTVHMDGTERSCFVPFEGAPFVAVDGWVCECGETNCVRSDERVIALDDRAYEGRAYCVGCKRAVGRLRVEMGTLFGLEEDEAVMRGRARVYG